ncbi:MAG: polyphenol oxidase family protein [Verrucomicrobiales bacterium]
MDPHRFIETYPALSAVAGLVHGFVLKHPDIDVKTDRTRALERLEAHHVSQLRELGIARDHVATGGQVHGKTVAACDEEAATDAVFPETDALVTATPGQFLGVYVADCAAVFVVDPAKRACAVAHSGKKGTELGVVPEAISTLAGRYGSKSADLIVQIAPCIRPPAYEVDFAARIVADCLAAGVPEDRVHDCGICTTSDPDRYYSYRVEKGKTGRLFAVIGWRA